MAKSLAGRLEQSGHFYDRILEFPLALCDEFGQMRSRNKSAFKQALLQIHQLLNMFFTTPPVLLTGSEVIIDALKFIHCPPAPSVYTCYEYVKYLFRHIVQHHGAVRGAKCITVVFDKPVYLPNIRQTIHIERKKRTTKTRFTCSHAIHDDDPIPHGEMFAEALTDARYKSLLINYISLSFPVLAKSQQIDEIIIIDSETYSTPIQVACGQTISLPARKNNKGEADCGVWFHAAHSDCDTVVIHDGDTDVFMYGLALYEQGHFQDKNILVERAKGAEYVSINEGCAILNQLPLFTQLAQERQAWTTLLAIYLLSGSDYISGFFRISHDFMMKVFLKYLPEVVSNGKLIKTDHSGKFVGLAENAFTSFISFVYLEKHVKLYSHLYTSAAHLKHALFISNGTFNAGLKTLLSWLQYELSSCSISTEPQFNDFVRRVCFLMGQHLKICLKQ